MNWGFKTIPKETDIAKTIRARDFHGMSNDGMTVVMEYESNSDREHTADKDKGQSEPGESLFD